MIAVVFLALTTLSGDLETDEDLRVRALVLPAAEESEGAADALYAAFAALGVDGVDREDRVGVDLAPGGPVRLLDEAQSPDAARDALLAARAAFADFDVNGARARLAEAERALLGLRAPETHRDLFADVLLLRAEVALAASDAAAATLDLRRVARLLPDREALHPGLYAPALVEAYAAAREANAQAPRATLVLWPRVPAVDDVEVLIDGVAQQGSADRSFALPAGPHLLTVRAEGRVTRSRFVQLSPGAPLVWEPLLFVPEVVKARVAAVEALRGATPSSEPERKAATQLLALSGATWLVLPAAAGRPLRVFTVQHGMLEVPDATGTALAQASAVQAAVLAAATPVAVGPITGGPVEGGGRSDPEAGEADALLTWGVLGGAAGTAMVAAVGVAVVGGVSVAYWMYANREIDPPAVPPKPVEITCCRGAP